MMHLDDFIHRVLPAIGPLALLVAVAHQHQRSRSPLLLASALFFAITFVASVVSAWLGLQFDESHELPAWYSTAYWWSTQWVVPAGYAIAGLSFLAFSMRKAVPRGA